MIFMFVFFSAYANQSKVIETYQTNIMDENINIPLNYSIATSAVMIKLEKSIGTAISNECITYADNVMIMAENNNPSLSSNELIAIWNWAKSFCEMGFGIL